MIQVFPVRLIFFVQVDQSFHLHCSVIGISSNNTYHIHTISYPPDPPLYNLLSTRPSSLQSPIHQTFLFTISNPPDPPLYNLQSTRPSSLQSPIHPSLGNNEKDVEPFFPSTNKCIDNFIICF